VCVCALATEVIDECGTPMENEETDAVVNDGKLSALYYGLLETWMKLIMQELNGWGYCTAKIT